MGSHRQLLPLTSRIILAKRACERLDLLLSYSDRVLVGGRSTPNCQGDVVTATLYTQGKMSETLNDTYLFGSLYWAFAYIAFAVISVTLFPMIENPIYDSVPAVY